MGQGIDLIGTLARVVPERPPPAIDGSRLRTVLIVKLSSMGDVIHALPVASALKRTYPALRITWAVEERFSCLVSGHPAIDRVICFPVFAWPRRPRSWARAIRRAIRQLQSETYDLVVDLQGLAKSAWVGLLSRSPLRIARQGQREGAHLLSYGVPMPVRRLHAVEEYLEMARLLGADPEPVEFGLSPRSDAAANVDALLAGSGAAGGGRRLVLNPSGSKPWTAWPVERWARVADALSGAGQVVLIGSVEQRERHRAVASSAHARPIDLTGTTPLPELVALLSKTTLHIAQDTGSLHLAAALGCRVVGIYGPSRPWRLAPFGQLDSVVEHGHLCGRGCPAYCLHGRRCLRAVTAEEVIQKAYQVLDAEGPARRARTKGPDER